MQYTPAEIANEILTYSKSKNKYGYVFIESQFKLRVMIYLMDLIWEEERGEYLHLFYSLMCMLLLILYTYYDIVYVWKTNIDIQTQQYL